MGCNRKNLVTTIYILAHITDYVNYYRRWGGDDLTGHAYSATSCITTRLLGLTSRLNMTQQTSLSFRPGSFGGGVSSDRFARGSSLAESYIKLLLWLLLLSCCCCWWWWWWWWWWRRWRWGSGRWFGVRLLSSWLLSLPLGFTDCLATHRLWTCLPSAGLRLLLGQFATGLVSLAGSTNSCTTSTVLLLWVLHVHPRNSLSSI